MQVLTTPRFVLASSAGAVAILRLPQRPGMAIGIRVIRAIHEDVGGNDMIALHHSVRATTPTSLDEVMQPLVATNTPIGARSWASWNEDTAHDLVFPEPGFLIAGRQQIRGFNPDGVQREWYMHVYYDLVPVSELDWAVIRTRTTRDRGPFFAGP